MPGGLLCRRWHGGLTGPGLAATLDERPVRPLPKVWPCRKFRQVTYDDVPTRNTRVRDVGGDQGSEVHGGGRIVPGETHKKFPMPGVWSWAHHGVNGSTLLMHAWDGTRNQLDPVAGHPDGSPISGVQYDLSAVN